MLDIFAETTAEQRKSNMPEVRLEETIYLLPHELICAQRRGEALPGATWGAYDIQDGAPSTVPAEHYHGYRRGKVGACSDIIAWTYNDDGIPAAILTFRKEGVCFEKKWWMQGGAIDAFAPVAEFVARCAKSESGSLPKIEALVGFFRTTEFVPGVERRQISTIQSAYIGYVDRSSLRLQADSNHTSAVLMTERMYSELPEAEKHWYPTLLLQILFETMPAS